MSEWEERPQLPPGGELIGYEPMLSANGRSWELLEVTGWLLVTLAAVAAIVPVGLAGHWTIAVLLIGVVLLCIGSVLVYEVGRRREPPKLSSR